MGQRCNLIIVEGGAATIYYDHWAANVLDEALFWGPDETLAFIRARDAVDKPLLNDTWGEGGAVVDLDRQHLVWFGGEDIMYDHALKCAHAALMARNWVGWRIDWCFEGVGTLADAIGVSRDGLMTLKPDLPLEYEPEQWREGGNILLSQTRDSKVAATRLSGDIGGLALMSAADIDALVSDDPVPLANASLAGGAHIDPAARTLSYWCTGPTAMPDDVAAAWEGRTVEFWGDAWERHRAVTAELDWREVNDAAARDTLSLLRRLVEREDGNLASKLLETMQKEGKDVKLNPATFEARKPTDTSTKLALLDAFEAELKAI